MFLTFFSYLMKSRDDGIMILQTLHDHLTGNIRIYVYF
jgi:hypothetical protein